LSHMFWRPKGGSSSKWEPKLGTFFDLKADNIKKQSVNFNSFSGKVVLVVNVASF